MGYRPCMDRTLEIPTLNRSRIDQLSAALKCHPVLSTLLINRDITDSQTAIDFLQPSLKNLRPPHHLCDIDSAVQRITAAIEKDEKILVFGDYDVDGVTATCLLTEFLEAVGAQVAYYIPHRVHEGYSLNTTHIHNGTVPADTGLIITVDCGVSSRDAVVAAAKTGIDVIITDHHTVTKPLPEAIAVINPNRADCPSGLGTLAGVGVVFYLVIALRKELRLNRHFKNVPEPNLKKLCDLVALGTVADVVPLVRENRILTSVGLDVINSGARSGLKRLIEISRIHNGKVDSEDIAFRLAPRLNAAGRLKHASEAVELLRAIGDDPAVQMATALDDLNSQRREIERVTSEEIDTLLARSPAHLNRPAIVLGNPAWHPGITGIVAARLARQYQRPALLVSMPSDIGKGSGRSIPGIDIIGCLKECAPLLERYGGHPAAAGITVTKHNFESFRELFEKAVQKRVDRGIPPERIQVDCELDFAGIQAGLMDALALLEPFGQGNPEPLFVSRRVNVLSAKTVGQDHTRLMLSQHTNGLKKTLAAIYFNSGTVPEKADRVVYALRWNHWNGRKRIQAIIKYMQ